MDYSALATQNGGKVDYSALAKQAGGRIATSNSNSSSSSTTDPRDALVPTGLGSKIGNFVSNAAKSIVKPLATSVVRPGQAIASSISGVENKDTPKQLQSVTDQENKLLADYKKTTDPSVKQQISKQLHDLAGQAGKLLTTNVGSEVDNSVKIPGIGTIDSPKGNLNIANVKKEAGTAIQTVAFGLDPIAGGTAFGAGNSLEQGNKVLSWQTAFQTALGAGAGKVLDLVGKPVFNAAGKVLGSVTPKFLEDLAGKGTKAIQDFAEAHNILPEKVSTAINGAADKVNAKVEQPFDAISQKASDLKTAVKNTVMGKVEGKTQEQILATPESQLYKLSPEERQLYFANQKASLAKEHNSQISAIDEKHQAIEQQIKTESDKQIVDIQAKNKDLETKVANASINEAQSLKPVVKQAMADNSKIYRGLIDKEIAPVKDVPVTHEEIWQFLQDKNAENPQKAADIAKTLGLKDNGETTVGQIYDNMKALKQEISKGAKKGTQVFTADDIKTNDAISAFSDFLKNEKGVDFTEANKFWSQYAPLRDKLIKNIQPFTPKGAESATFNTFTKGIQDAVSGSDPYNANFINETEKLLGQKIGNRETRAAIAKLDDGQKAEIVAKIEAKSQQIANDLEKEKAKLQATENHSTKQEQLKAKAFEIDRQARTAEGIKKILKRVGIGILGLEGYKHFGKILP